MRAVPNVITINTASCGIKTIYYIIWKTIHYLRTGNVPKKRTNAVKSCFVVTTQTSPLNTYRKKVKTMRRFYINNNNILSVRGHFKSHILNDYLLCIVQCNLYNVKKKKKIMKCAILTTLYK